MIPLPVVEAPFSQIAMDAISSPTATLQRLMYRAIQELDFVAANIDDLIVFRVENFYLGNSAIQHLKRMLSYQACNGVACNGVALKLTIILLFGWKDSSTQTMN